MARNVIVCVDIVDHALVEQQADYVGESPLDSCDEDGLASLHREGRREVGSKKAVDVWEGTQTSR